MLLQVAIFVEEREDSYTSKWAITYVVDEAKLNSEWSVLLEILGISLQAIESIARGAITGHQCKRFVRLAACCNGLETKDSVLVFHKSATSATTRALVLRVE